MPRTRRASGNRRRTKLHELIWQMETPLTEAIDFVEALRMMGDGLSERGCDDRSAVLRVVEAAQERLRSVEEVWSGLVRAKGRWK
jgi:hypothetical protein